MKKILIALSLTASLFTGANSHAETGNNVVIQAITDSQLLGSWKSLTPVYNGADMVIFLAIAFQPNTVTLSTICNFPGGKTLEAAVEVKANVGNGKLEVTESAQSEVVDGRFRCNVSTEPHSIDYAMVGSNLRLTADGQTLDLSRR